jgi:hypothetical protein
MKRRRVAILIEAETVLTVRELRALAEMRFPHRAGGDAILSIDPDDEGACKSLGTITQVQVNVVQR